MKKRLLSFHQIDHTNIGQARLDLLALAVGNPSDDKLHRIRDQYANDQYSCLFGAYIDSALVGIIGLSVTGKHAEIKHIAVQEKYRHQKIGHGLIQHAISELGLEQINAETDIDSKGFYAKCGFKVDEFQGHYGQRFRCQLHRDK
jgi:hypothetical protein